MTNSQKYILSSISSEESEAIAGERRNYAEGLKAIESSLKNVTNENDLMIIKKSGVAIRLGVENMRVMGRATQGVRLITLKDNEHIAAVTKVNKDEKIF